VLAQAPANTAPLISQLTSSSNTVLGGGAWVKLTGAATDAEAILGSSQFSWRCSPQPACGSFFPANGPTVYWQSPPTGGTYVLTLTVSDGDLETSQATAVVVQTGSGMLQVNPP
jgi:hypothetical protein